MTTDRRLPLQGGLPAADTAVDATAAAGDLVEIACDESGFSGSNLLDPGTPVLVHASVDLRVEEAADLVDTARSGFRWSLNELKSGQFLRDPRSGEALEWLLAALEGRAHVHLIDKELFLVTRVLDLFLGEPSWAAGTHLAQDHLPAALALHRSGRASGRPWDAFLDAFVDLVRSRRRQSRPGPAGVARFFLARDDVVRAGLDGEAAAALTALDRSRVCAVLARLDADDRSIPPPLEPLLPALAETVLFWSGGHRRVLVVHDEQSALTPGRLRRLQGVLGNGGHPDASPLAGLVTVDSRDDPRVQLADLLAGVARRTTTRVGNGPLGPFLSPTSLRDPPG